MPGEPPKPKDERTEAEDRAIVAVEEVVKILSFHVGALGHIPNPNAAYRNRINQQGLFDLIRKLCFVVSPPLKMFNEEAPPEPRVPLIHVCIDCGGPATC
jgi:hypothetical protein